MYTSLSTPPPQYSQNFQVPEIIVEQNPQKDGEEKDGEKEPAAAVLATETAVRGKKDIIASSEKSVVERKTAQKNNNGKMLLMLLQVNLTHQQARAALLSHVSK